MNEISFMLNEAELKNGLFFMFVALLAIVVVIKNWTYIIEKFGIVTAKTLHEKEQEQAIEKLKEHVESSEPIIESLKAHADKTDRNVDEIMNRLSCLQNSVDNLTDKVNKMQEKQDAGEAARLRDRISQAYHVFKKRGGVTLIEKEATLGLIEEYRKYHSMNSFVNDTVAPYIQNCTVIEE